MQRSGPEPSSTAAVAATGVHGLDTLLRGGLARDDMHVVQGGSGTGKTTLALQYLREGVRLGEPGVFITLSQSRQQLVRIAASHGWSLDGIAIHEFAPETLARNLADRQTVLPTPEVELLELFRVLQGVLERVKPARAVVDSLGVVDLLAGSVRYLHEVVMLRQLFLERGCALLAIADDPGGRAVSSPMENSLHILSGCVIELDQEPRAFGEVRRHLRIVKARGIAHQGGYHDFKIATGHLEVFPRLAAYVQPESRAFTCLSSGIANLDRLLDGGLHSGTSCLIVGPSGTGKSALASVFAEASARRGARAALFLFDDRPETYLENTARMGVDLRQHRDAGTLRMTQIDPGSIAPGEFGQICRTEVEQHGTKVVVIDSLLGYFAAMGSIDELMPQLHELVTYLTRRDVLLLFCGALESFTSIGMQRAVDVSYLSDTIIALTFFERDAVLRRAIAVTKNKCGGHLSTIHDASLVDGHLHVQAEPLRGLRHIMVAHAGE